MLVGVGNSLQPFGPIDSVVWLQLLDSCYMGVIDFSEPRVAPLLSRFSVSAIGN
jgi:hypothetical protein